ncbi:MAG: hypothetical protein WC171_06880, partial [Bacteroidales bacterium]
THFTFNVARQNCAKLRYLTRMSDIGWGLAGEREPFLKVMSREKCLGFVSCWLLVNYKKNAFFVTYYPS